jgi:hypothetical protein
VRKRYFVTFPDRQLIAGHSVYEGPRTMTHERIRRPLCQAHYFIKFAQLQNEMSEGTE